ncbi:MAG TPA: GAF and ANTAR domain-containing protein [Acidothermaceae bacterium]
MTDKQNSRRVAAGTSREQALANTFIALADTLVDDYDIVELLDQLVNACVNLLGVSAAGLLLDDQKGNLAVVASSSEETRLLEVFQLQKDEGPCLDCVRSGVSVSYADMRAELARWPLFVPAAVAAGVLSVTAVPLRLRDQTIGGLNLFDDVAEAVPPGDRRMAQALADMATIGILHRRSAHRSTVVAEQLQHALNSRIVIEQAKGVLAERSNMTMERAFEVLRRHARNNNLKLTDVALAVVRGELFVSGTGTAAGGGAGPQA